MKMNELKLVYFSPTGTTRKSCYGDRPADRAQIRFLLTFPCIRRKNLF